MPAATACSEQAREQPGPEGPPPKARGKARAPPAAARGRAASGAAEAQPGDSGTGGTADVAGGDSVLAPSTVGDGGGRPGVSLSGGRATGTVSFPRDRPLTYQAN